jgi:hypothetical protein
MGKILFQTFNRGSKKILGENENISEKDIDSVIEIDINTVKQAIMRMKCGRATRP